MNESVVLCEGYHDRAFWDGWLAHLGCSSARYQPNAPGGQQKDPWGKPIRGGQYGYDSKTGQFLRVVPCRGKQIVLPEARRLLRGRTTQPLKRLVLNIDSDFPAGSTTSVAPGLSRDDVLAEMRRFDPAASLVANDEIALDAGATLVSLIRWETSDPVAEGLPGQQSLERLLCASIVAAYPDRAPAVHHWLSTRPDPPPGGAKEYSWSYMAGWYAENGCDDFFRHVWRDPSIASQLRHRLSRTTAWALASALAA